MKHVTVPIRLMHEANKHVFYTALANRDMPVIKQGLEAFNLALQYLSYVTLHASRGVLPLTQHQWEERELCTDPAKLIQLSQADAFPTTDGRVVSVTFEQADEPIDLTWVQLYATDDMRNTNEESLEIWAVFNGVSFRVYENGEKVDLFGMSGSKLTFDFQLLGSGFQWLVTWLNDNKFWRLTNGLAEAATQYGIFQATLAYTVLAAAAPVPAPPTIGLPSGSQNTLAPSLITPVAFGVTYPWGPVS